MDKHKVAVKVLRISRPIIRYDNIDAALPIPVDTLSLPGSFGNVYVGEPFGCLLSVNKDNGTDQSPITIKLSVTMVLPETLKTGASDSSVVIVPDTKEIILDKDCSSYQCAINYEARDPGLHVLNVTVTYSDEKSHDVPITFRKNYRFSATPGLSVKTKISTSDLNPELHLVQAQIENISESCLSLETIELLAQEGFSSSSVSPIGDFQLPALAPGSILQSLFIVKPDGSAATVPSDSKLTLSWRREPMGEKGWLTTNDIGPLERSK